MRRRKSNDGDALRSFADRTDRPDDALGYLELQGFLFTVACAPEMVPPSEWQPIIFGEAGPNFADIEEAQSVLADLMALYNETNEGAVHRSCTLRDECSFRDPILSNFDDDAPVARWARGFVAGHLWLEDTWEDFVSDEMDEELGSVMMVLSFFSSRGAAEDYLQELTDPGTSLADLAGKVRELFPDAMRSYANLGRSIHEDLVTFGAEDEPADVLPKVGRNDPCPCGSGRKYKRCQGVVY